MAVKKKAVAKKAAPKKSTAKKVAKKSVAKKSTAKKTTAKKTAKKSAPKKVAKKAVAKKTTAKKTAKKSAPKKVAKKAVAKKTAKKAPARKSAASSVVIPPVPTGASRDRVNVSTTPAAPVKPAASAVKPSAAPRQGSSKSVLVAVLLGVAILTAIVASQKSNDNSAKSDTPAATATESASPAATDSASPAASTDTTNAATTGEAPSRFIGNWKDATTKEVLVLSWKAPAGDVKGYKIEIAPNGTGWKEISQIPATQLSFDLKKTSDSQYTSFRVSAIYADGSIGVAKAFGFAGQYE